MATSWTFNPFTGNLDAVGGSSSEFNDSTFRIYDNGDSTKKLAFEVSAVGTGTTKTITVGNENINISTGSSGSFANTNLSNLDAPTAVNEDILPSGTKNLGSAAAVWNETYSDNVISNTNLILRSRNTGGTDSPTATLKSGDSTSGDSGAVVVRSGTSTGSTSGTWSGGSGNAAVSAGVTLSSGTGSVSSGSVTLSPGASGSRGKIKFVDGSEGTSGRLWTSTATDGSGAWGSTSASSLVVGPASATDNAIVRFDGTTGKLTQNSSVTVDDNGILAIPVTASGTPGFTFTGDLDTGFGSNAANSFAFVSGGTNRLLVDTAKITATLPIRTADGTDAIPSYSFINSTDTGIYSSGVSSLDFSAGGTGRVQVTTTALQPVTNNTTDLGTSSKRWGQLVCNNIVVKSGASMTYTDGADAPILSLSAITTSPSGLNGPGLRIRKNIDDPFNIFTESSAVNDATNTDSMYFETGNKTAGTGNSGSFNFRPGTSAGGLVGAINIINARQISYTGVSDYFLSPSTINTTNATTASMSNAIATTAGETYILDSKIMARQTGGVLGTVGDSAGFKVEATFKNVAGTLSILGVAIVTPIGTADDLTWTATVIASGANIVLRVTGAASKNITWEAMTHIYRNA